jgi:hypothetical protein
MSTINKSGRRFLWLWGGLALASCLAVVTAKSLIAQMSGADVYRVEEDWQLVVGDPDYLQDGPQVTCTISPVDMSTAYCAFDINYHTQPDYQSGGVQIHTWDPQDPIEIASSFHTETMATSGETVTWTQTMTLNPNAGAITFQVINGQSQTWGNFGGQKGGNNGELILTLPTQLANLDSYSSDVSLNNSGVSFASNLVVSQTLMAVRWYDINGNLIGQNTTPQIVHPQD